MYHFLWPKANQTQVLQTQVLQTPKLKPIQKETCDLCFLKKPINKWYSENFFICNKCASCEHCNKFDDKIKRELDINEITQICGSCA